MPVERMVHFRRRLCRGLSFFCTRLGAFVRRGAILDSGGGLLLAVVGNGLSALLSLLITRYLLRAWSENFSRGTRP